MRCRSWIRGGAWWSAVALSSALGVTEPASDMWLAELPSVVSTAPREEASEALAEPPLPENEVTQTRQVSTATGTAAPSDATSALSAPPCLPKSPSKPVADKPVANPACCHGCKYDRAKQPGTIRTHVRPGNFPIPPAPPGYYSLSAELHGKCSEKPPKSGYPGFALMPPGFFDADFRYVDGIPYDDRTLVEKLKRIECNDCLMLSTGGQAWARFMNEHNSRLTEADNSYVLSRVRTYGDLTYGDLVRVYGEYLWADSFAEDLAPAAIDVNRGDIQNLFVDLHAFDYEEKPVYVRAGRQELMIGSQRLVSALDWANTRRTFDGVRVFRQGEKWDFDAFFAQFVPVQATELDRADENQNLAGTWLTYRPEKSRALESYYLYFDNSNTTRQQNIVRAPIEIHTLGSRYSGDKDGYLWDFELMMQLGEQQDANVVAGAATAGVGRHWKEKTGSPTAWIYYDYASGDSNPGSGDVHTFNQLFPFGHYYLGWIDLVGRQNIHDLNLHYTIYPAHWMTTMVGFHQFWLDSASDALYNVGGNAYRRDATGQAGRNVGSELDFLINFHLDRYSDLLVGYSKLFGGDFLEATAGANQAVDSELLYLMYQRRW